MGLAETQEALARLYTDADVRDRFFAGPRARAPGLGLSEAEAEALASVEQDRLRWFARSLVAKRLSAVASLLPLTTAALGADFPRLFRAHAREYLPTGTKKHRDDALAFLRHLEARAGLPRGPVLDTARYEACWLLVTEPRPRCLVRLLRLPSVTEDAPPSPASGPPSLAVWIRIGATVHHWAFPRRRSRVRTADRLIR
jgi:hypothetical protein